MSENTALAHRIAELEKQLDKARSRISELERDEPFHDDIVALRKALTNAGIAGPESDETLAWNWLSYVRQLMRAVGNWEFVPAAERDALAAAIVTALRGTQLDDQGNRDDDGLLPHHETHVAIKALAEVECLAIKAPGHGLLDIQAKAVESLRFPVMLRRMWSGGEVQDWLKGEAERIRQPQHSTWLRDENVKSAGKRGEVE